MCPDADETNGIKRIDLSDGQWAELRMEPGTTAADLRAAQLSRVRDKRDMDLFLDTLATFPTRIKQWSYGPVTQERIDALESEDTMLIVRTLIGLDEPVAAEERPLVDSSAGTSPTTSEPKDKRSRRGSGS